MSEHMEPIPSRIYNAAVGGHVAGADQIIDDETGLTLDKVTGGALEEKTYTSGSNNGMGRVVLRKNLVNGVNTLVQIMINKSNTIYVIQYDFTLGEDITIPANCILEFDGGSINGSNKITFYDTKLSGNPKVLCDFEGNISNGELNISWFGITPSTTSQQNRFQKVIDLYASNVSTSSWDMHMNNPEPKIIIPNGKYNFGNITLRSFLHIQGAGRAGTELWHTHLKGSGIYNIKLSDFTLTGDKSKDDSIDIEDVVNGATSTGVKEFSEDYSIGLYLIGGARYIFNNVCIQNYDICFCGDEAYSAEWYSCYLSYCTIGYLNYGYNNGHAGHNVHFIGGEIANFKYGFVQNSGESVSIDDSCIEGGNYAVYVRTAGHINIERNYFEANLYDIWANGRQTKIINNFLGGTGKSENGYYIYLNETQADIIKGNFFGRKTNNNHIAVSHIYRIPYIYDNYVLGSDPLTADDGLYINVDHGRFASDLGVVNFTEHKNSVFGTERVFGVTSSNGVTRYLRAVPGEKATIPVVIHEWDLGSAQNALDSNCAGTDIFYTYANKPAWFDGTKFVDANGYTVGHFKTSDTTAKRPTGLTSNDIGFRYFDTTLNKPIYWTGTAWVDATGATV